MSNLSINSDNLFLGFFYLRRCNVYSFLSFVNKYFWFFFSFLYENLVELIFFPKTELDMIKSLFQVVIIFQEFIINNFERRKKHSNFFIDF